MKRIILAVVLVFGIIFAGYGQTSEPIDLVLVLDTSSRMSSSYDHVNNYITGPFLNEFLRVGDTFHLIAFSGNQRLDVSRRISGLGDVQTIIGRMLLQYPVESGNNVGAALSYAEQYIRSLPSRPKKIVLVTLGASDTGNLVSASRGRLPSNTTIDYIQVTPGQPLSNLPASGRGAAAGSGRTTADSGTPGTTPRDPASGSGATATEQTGGGVFNDNNNDFSNNDFTDGDSANQTEEQDWQQGRQPDQLREADDSWLESLPLIIGIILLILLLLGLILLLSSRKLGSSPNRVMAQASSSTPPKKETRFEDHSKDLNKYAAATSSTRRTTPYDNRPVGGAPVINPSGPLILNLFVEDQNTAIGKRNIHSLKSGYSLSVGGGKSDDYLIFLVPIPSHIGEIRRNGSSLTFIPKKAKYFPDIGSGEVRDCINKTIRVVSDKNYEMRFRFEMYEDPLVALNRMLMSVKVPG
ncbi:MAG: VWA domain-containing protein [Treponema sp.]|nr:VWA domain-containing protein [Treponema sp.]